MAKGDVLTPTALNQIICVAAIDSVAIIKNVVPFDCFVVQNLVTALATTLVAVDLNDLPIHLGAQRSRPLARDCDRIKACDASRASDWLGAKQHHASSQI